MSATLVTRMASYIPRHEFDRYFGCCGMVSWWFDLAKEGDGRQSAPDCIEVLDDGRTTQMGIVAYRYPLLYRQRPLASSKCHIPQVTVPSGHTKFEAFTDSKHGPRSVVTVH